jgi:hypothetical protein
MSGALKAYAGPFKPFNATGHKGFYKQHKRLCSNDLANSGDVRSRAEAFGLLIAAQHAGPNEKARSYFP